MASTARPVSSLAGDDDGMERLWTPHRMAYIDSHGAGDDQDHAKACPFCTAPTLDDEEGLIVWRGQLAFVVMNAFPYNPGHLLICPYRHFGDYTQATTSEVAEIAELTRQAMRVTREVSNPDGFNLGMNQGRVAGAGVAEHLHQHVVPRWAGDANFFPIIGQTKAIPQLLGDTRARLAKAWERS